jgi:hypothetical protein
MEIQRYNFGVAGAARVGLTEVSFSAGDPANGAYIRQIDSASAFLVCRKSGIESAMDLGSGFASPRKVMFRARSNEVKAWMDGNYMGAITTNVPDSLLGLSISGGATTDSGGILLGAISIYYQPQVF